MRLSIKKKSYLVLHVDNIQCCAGELALKGKSSDLVVSVDICGINNLIMANFQDTNSQNS